MLLFRDLNRVRIDDPHATGESYVVDEPVLEAVNEYKSETPNDSIIWMNVFFITLWHTIALYGALVNVWSWKYATLLFGILIGSTSGIGVTAGAHRLWTHRSYKAKLPLQIILMVLFSMTGQDSIYEWVRDHRVHHKFSETDADPHNSKRGFFFSHVGWLMRKKHSEVVRRGKSVDMSDIINNPLVKFHTKYFFFFKFFLCFFIPTVIPVYFWNESWLCAIMSQVFIRYVIVLNITWSVNSVAHIWGYRPYNKNLKPVENKYVSFFSLGEGWHNYHHVFPWDYKASEFGNRLNVTAQFLELCAKIGWAYDMKSPSEKLIREIALKHGDGSYIPEQPILNDDDDVQQIKTN